jgi:hypothetical protein
MVINLKHFFFYLYICLNIKKMFINLKLIRNYFNKLKNNIQNKNK